MSIDHSTLRARIAAAPEPDWTTYCADCGVVVTEVDREAGHCTNCRTRDFYDHDDDGYYDGWETRSRAGGFLDDEN